MSSDVISLEGRLWYVKDDIINTKAAMKIMQQRVIADKHIGIK